MSSVGHCFCYLHGGMKPEIFPKVQNNKDILGKDEDPDAECMYMQDFIERDGTSIFHHFLPSKLSLKLFHCDVS